MKNKHRVFGLIFVLFMFVLATATISAEVTPTVNPIMYMLTVDMTENLGIATVTVTPPGQTIKAKTVFYYQPGTVVTLKANNYTYPAGGGVKFLNWKGDLTGTQNPATITMDTNKSVTVVWGVYDGPAITPTPRRRVTPTPTIQPVTPTPNTNIVSVAYVIQSDWGNGATVSVTIKNNGTGAINGWTLAWTFSGNQTITNLWNGSFTQSGASVSVKDGGHNANIPAGGGTVNFGFNLNYSGTNAKPTSFTLNGIPCQTL